MDVLLVVDTEAIGANAAATSVRLCVTLSRCLADVITPAARSCCVMESVMESVMFVRMDAVCPGPSRAVARRLAKKGSSGTASARADAVHSCGDGACAVEVDGALAVMIARSAQRARGVRWGWLEVLQNCARMPMSEVRRVEASET
jgi:hypothetical protein